MVTKFVNQYDFPIDEVKNHNPVVKRYNAIDPNSYLIPDLVPIEERNQILKELFEVEWQPVSVTGMSGNWQPGDPIGSYRTSNYNQEYADVLWNRIKDFIPSKRFFDDEDPTDWDGHSLWEPIGVSPLFRFIKYHDEGWLVVHYDAPYIESDDVRTLQSFVIYLDHSETITGGATRYLHDPQKDVPVTERVLTDEVRAADEDEIRLNFKPDNGTGVIFDHRMLHDAEKVKGEGSKIIIRTDVMYRKIH